MQQSNIPNHPVRGEFKALRTADAAHLALVNRCVCPLRAWMLLRFRLVSGAGHTKSGPSQTSLIGVDSCN